MIGFGDSAINFQMLVGEKVKAIHDTLDGDCGLVIEFDSGFCLWFAYSADEGTTRIMLREEFREMATGLKMLEGVK